MKIIDINTWKRKKAYLWFSSFSNPTYGVSARIDVTPVVQHVKRTGEHFYETMLYLTVKGLNRVPDLRRRISEGKVVEYDCPEPSVTVALEDGLFDVCRVGWDEDFASFSRRTRELIEAVQRGCADKAFGDADKNVYYFTCLPWLDYERMSDPIPDDVENASIPRICWGKYTLNDGRYTLNLNINVSHALVDGKPLCDAFAYIQQNIDDCERLLK